MTGFTDLICDLYGTLVDIHTEEDESVWAATADFFRQHGAFYTAEALRQVFLAQLSIRQAQAGQSYECFPDIPFQEIMAFLFHEAGIAENAEALGVQAAALFRVCSTEYIRLYPQVTEALKQLRRQGYRLWLLSNAQEVFTQQELKQLHMDALFDGIYISSRFGFRKPDQRFFRALIEEQHISPAHCLMIGNDRDTDIAGAKAAGLATLYMHTNLTPLGQAAADPGLDPRCTAGCRHWEWEGTDWQALTDVLIAKTAWC